MTQVVDMLRGSVRPLRGSLGTVGRKPLGFFEELLS